MTELEPARQLPYPSPVLLFKKILNFKKEGGLGDKRGATRYPVGLKYPLKAKVTLVGRDGEGHILKADDNRAMDWGGQLVNMSSGGVSMRLHPAAMGDRGENCRLKLELDHKLFEIDATVAHFWSGPQYATCGVALKFPDSHTQKAFRQLVEPVALGSVLESVDPKSVEQDAPGLKKEQYTGVEEVMLTVWRDESGKVIEHFELLVHDYYLRGSAQAPGLQIGFHDGAKTGGKGAMPPAQQNEVRQLFQLIVPNIPKAVPSDVRAFLERFAS
jgi:hypothetical protein